MPSNEALCLFLNQLGARVSDNGPESVTVRQYRTGFREIVEGTGELYLFPSLALFRTPPGTTASKTPERMEQYDFSASEERKSNASWPKETALRNLSRPVPYHGSELHRAPSELANRALDSFAFLVAANLRQFFGIQLRRHAQGGSGACAGKARDIASFFLDGTAGRCSKQEGKPIDILGASTSFHLEESEECDIELGVGPQRLTFHMDVDLCILGQKMPIPIKASGEMKASFETGSNLITGVTLTLDTIQLLQSMRTQARLVVLKAVAKKGFPVIHTDALVPIPQTSSDTHQNKDVAADKMKKLALCASLELATAINDSSPLSRGAKEDTPSRHSSTAKRRLSAAMGARALFVFPGEKPSLSAQTQKIARKNPLLGQSASSMLGQLVNQA